MKAEDRTPTFIVVLIAVLMFVGIAPAAGLKEKVLYRFKAGRDGANPYGSLIADAAGNLYGTTAAGGSKNCDAVAVRSFDCRRQPSPVTPGLRPCSIAFKAVTTAPDRWLA